MALLWSLGAPAAPRPLLTENKLAELRRQASVKGSSHEEMLARLRQKVEAGEATRGARSNNYGQAYQATMAAFLYQMTSESKYCAIAYDALRAVYEGANQETILPEQGYGLARATASVL